LSETWDLKSHLAMEARKDLLRLSTAGSVDDGKSTLIGRLLHDSQNIYQDQLEAIKTSPGRSGEPFDLAQLTDGLRAEREQGITIDVAYRYFATAKRKFIIADTPGHEQYTRNMATGASTADLALILIDARKGVITQSKRHAFIATLLQIPHLVVVVNKMDLVSYSESVFEDIKEQFTAFASKLQIHDLRFLPISALLGDNVVQRSQKMDWYTGGSLLELLETVHIASDRNMVDLRFPVQYVNRPDATFRGYAGQVVSGIVRPGAEITVLPSHKTSRVKAIHTFEGCLEEAFPPLSVTLTLEDELDISRGDMICHTRNRPLVSRQFEAMLVWMDDTPLDPKTTYLLKHTTLATKANVTQIRYRMDVDHLRRQPAESLALNEIGRVVLMTRQPICHDPYAKNRATGNFILIDPVTNHTVAAGMMIDREPEDQLPATMIAHTKPQFSSQRLVKSEDRLKRHGHRPLTIWLTGLASCGKTDLAYQLELALFERNYLVTVLHGGSMRHGISQQLSFSAADIAEHLRRVGETARLLNEAGMVVIGAFISPYAAQRDQVRNLIGQENFFEVFIDVPVSWCAKRDESGLYERAESGHVPNVAGVNAPYERPEHPDLTIPLHELGFDRAVASLLDLIERET